MTKQVEFFFDFGSPAAYLAFTQLPRIAADAGAAIVWRPMLLGGVFKATGNASPVMVAAKGKWMNADLARWAARYGVPLNMPPGFPINTLALMRGAVGMQLREPARFDAYVAAVYAALFGRGENLGDFEVVGRVLAAAGFDAAAFMALTADPEVKQGLIANTDEAVARGAFGAPTLFVGDEMHFGQDRLDFVARALAR
jgi:2-hydroxychromene-2-carboxylate isomerase